MPSRTLQRGPRLALTWATLLAPLIVSAAEPNPPSAPPTARLNFQLAVRGNPGQTPAGQILLAPKRGAKPFAVLGVAPGRRAEAVVPAGASIHLEAEFPGYWAFQEDLNLRLGEETRTHTVELWPTTDIVGRLVAKNREKLPAALVVQMEVPVRPDLAGKVPSGSLPCDLEPNGRFRCRLPLDRLDLCLRLAGYAPLCRWGYAVPSEGEVSWGELPLVRAATLEGRVELEGAESETAGAVALSLEPVVARAAGGEIRARLLRARRVIPLGPGGQFEALDLAPGLYRLEARAEGFSTASVVAPRLEEGAHLSLATPLLLRRRARLEVSVEPPLDARGKPWKIGAQPSFGTSGGLPVGEAVEATADTQGHAELTDLAAGQVDLTLSDSRGSELLYEPGVPVGQGAPSSRTLRPRLLRVRGTVRYGKEPVAGRLWFGGREGGCAEGFASDEKGHFEAILGRAGHWRLEVAGDRPELSASLAVDIAEPERGESQLEVSLPQGEVRGRVVDPAGRPAENVEVVGRVGEAHLAARSGPGGGFRFQVVPAGALFLSAQGEGGAASERVMAQVLPDGPTPFVELQLLGRKSFSGLVRSRLGPIPGAGLSVIATWPPAAVGTLVGTDLDGRFSAQVPDKTERASVAAITPANPEGQKVCPEELWAEVEPLCPLLFAEAQQQPS
ncbi:MAG TPA: carboxypeptidase-like regulatory domain-containing protein, partial [Thermoanaerobaculia bacterium]|nr:carboxypeptidase-like regulatory domain-containing protein [Thermoanaerobaculia bacterium]